MIAIHRHILDAELMIAAALKRHKGVVDNKVDGGDGCGAICASEGFHEFKHVAVQRIQGISAAVLQNGDLQLTRFQRIQLRAAQGVMCLGRHFVVDNVIAAHIEAPYIILTGKDDIECKFICIAARFPVVDAEPETGAVFPDIFKTFQIERADDDRGRRQAVAVIAAAVKRPLQKMICVLAGFDILKVLDDIRFARIFRGKRDRLDHDIEGAVGFLRHIAEGACRHCNAAAVDDRSGHGMEFVCRGGEGHRLACFVVFF